MDSQADNLPTLKPIIFVNCFVGARVMAVVSPRLCLPHQIVKQKPFFVAVYGDVLLL